MKHQYSINRMVIFAGVLGLLLPVMSYASDIFPFGGSVSVNIYSEDKHDKNLELFRTSLLKNSASTILLTDSMVVYNNYANGDSSQFHKVTYEYHPDNRLASVFYYQRNSAKSVWESFQKEEFEFNAASNQTTFTVFLKSENGTEWVHQLQRAYLYNSDHQLLVASEFLWDESTATWVGQWKNEIAYNSAKFQKSKITYGWNRAVGDWSPLLKQEFEYQTSGELYRSISYGYNLESTLWEGQQKSEYDFVDGVLNEQTDYIWDLHASPAVWVASNKKEFLYNGQGEQLSWKWYRWNRDYLKWDEWWKIEHSEDHASSTSTWMDAQWDGDSEAWISNWRMDTKGEPRQQSEEAVYVWNIESASWHGLYRLDFVYGDEDQLFARGDYQWDEALDAWSLHQKNFYYSFAVESDAVNIFVPKENVGSADLKVYPNPAQHMVHFESSSLIHSIQVYAPDGRLLGQIHPNSPTTELSVLHLPAGVYIIKTGTANGTRFSKIVVKK